MKDIQQLTDQFVDRHIGPNEAQITAMLQHVGADSLDQLVEQTIPANIRLKKELDLPAPKTEVAFLQDFEKMMRQNKVFKSYIGLGYHDCITPPVIQRNILENPAWYTAYTPYQAEIAQGRMEALINYQTVVTDLTGMELANASLLDEGTAAAEAMTLLYRVKSKSKKQAKKFFIEEETFPHTIELIKGRAAPLDIEIVIGKRSELNITDPDLYGVLLQYPNCSGAVIDPSPIIAAAIENEVKTVIVADLMSLVLLKSPGAMGADAVVGTSQRFGIPLGYGGPHAAYFATKKAYKRQMPGRIIGSTEDRHGNLAYRMALQTREQHIRREKATSNICTAQVLLAVMAGMYAVYHGKQGLTNIATRIHLLTTKLDQQLQTLGFEQVNQQYFDTVKIKADRTTIEPLAVAAGINFRYFESGHIGISLNETTTVEDVEDIIQLFGKSITDRLSELTPSELMSSSVKNGSNNRDNGSVSTSGIKKQIRRTSPFLTHPTFNTYQAEHEMLRYIKSLENKDLSLVHSMIPLGSCTMKLNASTEMMPLSWGTLANIHPFVPVNQAAGYHQLFEELAAWLAEITGFATTSLQPNSGAQGELAGLMVIKALFEDIGEGHRNITLIPSSAHGTNPASAVMAGQKVVIVKCLDNGDIDLVDLKAKAEEHKEHLMSLMVTYPSTHGVFEEGIKEACEIIHQNGGRVYMDGANLNAQVGLTAPGIIGADVCHINLHKTFCIPHGGGGPGMGPISVTAELAPYLPGNAIVKDAGGNKPIAAISAAPWGSASILSISYAYISMMGAAGLKRATEVAILNANYIKDRLKGHYPILFMGKQDRNAHELIIDCRGFKEAHISVADIAKRLMDYGFHAPTVSFPVAGTMMIEPTESETKQEIDRFCEAMIQIRKEIQEVQDGIAAQDQNVLVNAPHTLADITSDEWTYPYPRSKAAYPLPFVKDKKFWPSVGRTNDAMGDRNLMCSCPPVEAFAETEAVI